MNNTKKILVDAMPFDYGRSGISVYTLNVVHALEQAGHDVTVAITAEDVPSFKGSKIVEAPSWAAGAIGSILYHIFCLPKLLRHGGYDFCLVTAANRRFPASSPIPVIGTIHDLAQCHVRGKYDNWRNFYLNHVLARWVRQGATRVVAISQSTQKDIEEYWKISTDRIGVIYNGLTLSPTDEPGFLANHNLTKGGYILYVSRLEHPGKNHLRLIQAYEQLPRELAEQHKLVMVGSPWKKAEILEEYVQHSPLRNNILFTGFVPSAQMPEAYRSASLYVFPSCFEGFGLSLVEAMHYGCPCCCSDNSSLGEIGKDAALLFPPEDIDAIRDAMQKILENHDGIRERLITAGRDRAAQFDWNRHAAEIVQLYENAIGKKEMTR
jgi:glycosyltransferase involved in cell wall biosynthesis